MQSGDVIRVLVIEDDEDDLYLTRELLQEVKARQYDVTWEREPAEGLQALCSQAFDVALVDYYVSGTTGVEILTRAVDAGVETPAILLTGLGSEDVDFAAMQAGAYDYLEKGSLSSSLLDRSIRYAMQAAGARSELSEKSALLETTLNSASAGIALFNRAGNLVNWNSRFASLLDLDAAEPASEFEALVRKRLGDLIEHGRRPFELRRSGGDVTEVRVEGCPDGGRVVVCIDVSERIVFQNHLVAAKEQAEAASQAKSNFIASISHELRTPLNSIIGFSDLIESDLADSRSNETHRGYVGHIRQSADHLLGLINNILDLSEIEAGRWELEEEPLDLCHVVRMAVALVTSQAETSDVDLQLKMEAGIGLVYADANAMKKIIINLLSNAVKFTGSGGQVKVGLELRPGDGIALSVSDTGIGIPSDAVQRIMEPFEQVDSGSVRRWEGMGLGLPIVKRLIELHDGSLEISSVVDEGTRVTVSIPPNRCRPMVEQAPSRGAALVS